MGEVTEMSKQMSGQSEAPLGNAVDSIVSSKSPLQKEKADKQKQVSSKDQLTTKRTQLGLPPLVPGSGSPSKEASAAKSKPETSHKKISLDDPEFETMATMSPKPIAPPSDLPEEEVTLNVSDDLLKEETQLEDSDREVPQPVEQTTKEPDEALQGAPPIPEPDADLLSSSLTSIPEGPDLLETTRPKSFKRFIFAILAVVLMELLIFAVAFFYFGRDDVASTPVVSGRPSNDNKASAALPALRQFGKKPLKAVTEPIKQVLAAAPAAIDKPAIESPAAPPPKPVPPEPEPAPPEPEPALPKSAPPEPVSPAPESMSPEPEPAPSEPAPSLPEKETVAPVEESDMVVITLTGVPKGAEVLLNGEPSEKSFTVPRSQKALKVEVRLSGYEDVVRRVVPGQDKTLRIHMTAQ